MTIEKADDLLTVRVSGRLAAGGAEELERACAGARRIRLDLAELVSADEGGTRLLSRLRGAGAELVGTPPYIDLLLRARSGQDS